MSVEFSKSVTSASRQAPPRRRSRLAGLQQQVERLINRMNIAVIYGGDKSVGGAVINRTTNPRSWKSYQAVAEDIAGSLCRLGCRRVSLMPDDMFLGDRLRMQGIDFAWLNTGGVQGYSSMAHAPAMLEMFGIPYLGHDPVTAGMLDNKHLFKHTLKGLGIPTAPYMTWHLARGPLVPERNRYFKKIFAGFDGPFIVKPVSGRASLLVRVAEDASDLTNAVTATYRATENHVLIEAYLPGREFCIAVCGRVTARDGCLIRNPGPFTFAALERVLGPDEKIFTSMDIKPITTSRVRLLDPDADRAIMRSLEEIGRAVFNELHLETLIRLDLRQDAQGRIMILEANPKPDLKASNGEKTSLICASLKQLGMSYDDLILSLLADRIDLLFSQRRGTVTTLLRLLEGETEVRAFASA
jgi:D-alanine-D-alanine ligase